ncbi:MAG: SRPBCC family protein [Plectolyngbya sp. WJT66-NPBG17]|jgi:ribosome-associated toxin RatA of RatAB toxin-antitoxin module|nr:SRPBCC family protein [Plectolyngbya sp. WJT66-NPBG17]
MTSAQQSVQTTDFEQSITMNSSADRIFEYLSDVRNVPQYLPTVTNAEPHLGERFGSSSSCDLKQTINVIRATFIAPLGAF